MALVYYTMAYVKKGLLLLVKEVSRAWMAIVKPTGKCLRRLLERATIVLTHMKMTARTLILRIGISLLYTPLSL
jgi:hypothetical protein